MKVKNASEAWEVTRAMFTNGLVEDKIATEKAGYKVYRDEQEYYSYVCDLGDRLELNFANGRTLNVWIGYEEPKPEITEEQMLGYLQAQLSAFKAEEARFGIGDRLVKKDLDALLACREMVESLIGKPVNLQLDGRVTVGF